jgi:cell division protein FtsW (lipid II flippase)
MNLVPSEVDIMGVYAPPLMIAVILGTIAMVLTVYLLNRHRLSRYFLYPELVMLALVSIYTTIIGTFVIPI